MQTATILRRIEMLPALSRAGKRINGLHRLMRSSDLYELAYDKVSRNKGAMTPGIDGKTFDGMSLEKLADLARRVAGVRLIGDMLRAGWMEGWKFERTYSGTPQGGDCLAFARQHLSS